MKISTFATAGLVALAMTQAQAADLPRRGDAVAPAPAFTAPPIFSWTGFYVGVNGGYGFGRFTGRGDTWFGKANGGLVGGTVGYNQQFGSMVVGLEGDWAWSGVKGQNTSLPGPVFGNAKLNSLMTLRGRAGYAIDNTLLYVTGGYAGGNVRSNITDASLPVGAQTFTTSNWNNGYALGAGVEYAFSRNISLKGEFLHTRLVTKPIFAAPRLAENGVYQNMLRAGVNYRF